MKFKQDFKADYGAAERMSERITRVLCENPSPYTYTGTGTYIVGAGDTVAVIDPGPRMKNHLNALLEAIDGKTVSNILVTHTHADHSPLARPLSQETGAKIYAFGPHGSGRKGGLVGEDVEAGADKTFAPDVLISDGDTFTGPDWTLRAVHTPGHTANHMCFHLTEENTVFVGDHVMAWATTVISPPDGDMTDYLASLRKLSALDAAKLVPTHGPWVDEPAPFIRGIITHRKMREGQISGLLEDNPATIESLVTRMYKDVDPRLHPAAARSVFAHILSMVDDGRLACDGPPQLDSLYYRPGGQRENAQ